MNLVNVTNHKLNEAQTEGYVLVMEMPEELKNLWAGIGPTREEEDKVLEEIIQWLRSLAINCDDHIAVQGHPGVSFRVVQKILSWTFIPVYAVSKRESVESVQPDGSVRKTAIFRHIRWAEYK